MDDRVDCPNFGGTTVIVFRRLDGKMWYSTRADTCNFFYTFFFLRSCQAVPIVCKGMGSENIDSIPAGIQTITRQPHAHLFILDCGPATCNFSVGQTRA